MKNYLSLYESQKTVEYFGLILTIPDERGYLSTDADGTVIFWIVQPTYGGNLFWDVYQNVVHQHSYTDCVKICKVNLNDIDWTTTLKEIK